MQIRAAIRYKYRKSFFSYLGLPGIYMGKTKNWGNFT